MKLIAMAGFNPRAHAGRDILYFDKSLLMSRFNPRAHAGRDQVAILTVKSLSSFQSTRPRGARRPRTGFRIHTQQVSIHAPTRGATVYI